MVSDEAPSFWWTRPGILALLLWPFGYLWGRVSASRMSKPANASVSVPVICVGNFIAGGAGKTPTAIALAEAASRRGIPFGFLSRGYGGVHKGVLLVDIEKHGAAEVGDEPLLLAAVGPTVISPNRYAGAARLVANGSRLIIMDDGFQNPSLAKDFSLVVADAKRGIGNGFTIPAGPMRAPLSVQFSQADAVLVIGDGPAGDWLIRQAAKRGKPIHTASLVADEAHIWQSRRCLAFAGIADPEKFYESLQRAGAVVAATRSFPDHHAFTEEEAKDLLAEADKRGLELVTTSKDMARIAGLGGFQEQLADKSAVFRVHLDFDDGRTPDMIINAAIAESERRIVRERSR